MRLVKVNVRLSGGSLGEILAVAIVVLGQSLVAGEHWCCLDVHGLYQCPYVLLPYCQLGVFNR